jgi:hypothetical protein
MATRDDDRHSNQRYAPAGGPPRRRHYPRSDERIRDDIAEQLYRGHIDASPVSVDVREGVVTLAGTVDSRRVKHDIEDLAARTPGVKEVDNRMRVAAAGSNARGDALVGSDGRAVSGRRSAAMEPPPGGLDTPQHEEWLLDEGVAESFPASDTPSSVQPGSIASRKAD